MVGFSPGLADPAAFELLAAILTAVMLCIYIVRDMDKVFD